MTALPYSDRFKSRCTSLISSIRGRAREIKDKNQRIIRRGYLIPFGEPELRDWLLRQLGGAEGGVCRCRFCSKVLDAYSCVVDHGTPLKRGGSPGLDNLGLTCASCNDIKGGMTAEEYTLFIELMRQMEIRFGPAPVRNITGRLESQTKLAAQARWNQAKEQKKKAEQVAAAIEDF